MPDESELVRQIRRGDEAAFRVLVDREARYLHGIAHALTGNAAEAEDLVQETFVGALSSRFREESSIRTWLVAILVRRAGMLRRSKSRRRDRQSLDGEAANGPQTKLTSPSGMPRADARLDLSTMLQSLSAEHRTIIVLRELQGMTYEEMAAVLGIPRGTVESRLFRAREELRQRYQGYL